ncbi:fumarylacetoacetate hydrolase family protein [Actinoplanes sp. ATCC 53533]|uniref:fumarylacetoacetate hydrolase family protein n=1 Tax=Actinoplanes sp. ATCC 53533 TaxID=1288362 RepID=UPI000F76ADA8|nr:fumarylacetoacetate hydrolase family protein [Actinoplanes sp. ATCC 53533]RSM64289.1 fumarylacetoacetate hydrolase family protein [Actinoplanes sp. ATCC 53533]
MNARHPLGLAPSKIIAVHLNYRSRAAERGRTPSAPSYFLKPPSSLSCHDAVIERPAGCRLMAFEGEIALVIGRAARGVRPEQAMAHVRWITAANDAGVYDLRYADRGSNLRSKGADGFTPVGPVLLDPASVDLSNLRLRTWVNGTPVQDASTAELIFPFDQLIADLSRLMTLEAGDIILTGTPAGASVVEPGDVVEVELGTTGRLANPIVDAPAPLAPYGAMPRFTEADRADAYGGVSDEARPRHLDARTAALLNGVSTATLSSVLRKRGLEHMFIEGVRPARPGLRLLGTAHTLEYLPLREDLFAARGGGMNAQKRAVEEIGPGQVLVIGARGEAGSGTIGDILALRALRRGATGIVTDGGLRDSPSFAALDLPTYHGPAHAAVLGRRHVPWAVGVAVACGGVLVEPGDVLVGDGEGVIVIPPGIAADVAVEAAEQERQERFIYAQVAAGAPIEGLYPLGPARKAEYQAWSAALKEESP